MLFLDCPSKMWSNIFAFIFFLCSLVLRFSLNWDNMRWQKLCLLWILLFLCVRIFNTTEFLIKRIKIYWLLGFSSFLTGDRFQGLSVKTETGETKRVWEGSRPSVPHAQMIGLLRSSRLWHDLYRRHEIVHFLTNLYRTPRGGPQSKRLGWYRINWGLQVHSLIT